MSPACIHVCVRAFCARGEVPREPVPRKGNELAVQARPSRVNAQRAATHVGFDHVCMHALSKIHVGSSHHGIASAVTQGARFSWWALTAV